MVIFSLDLSLFLRNDRFLYNSAPVCVKTAVKEVTGHAKCVCALKTIGNLFLTAGERT